MLDLHLLIFDVPDIPQQFQELICILFHGLLSQSQLMEFFNLVIIVPIGKVLLVDVPPEMPGATRYASLWVLQDKALQQMTNYMFTFYVMNISYEILKTSLLSNELFS